MSKLIRLFYWYLFYLNSISWEWGITVIITGIIFFAVLYRLRRKEKIQRKFITPLWFGVEYYFIVLSSTVFSRAKADAYRYDLNPFDIFVKLFNGNIDNRYEIYLNILLLLPIGFLLSSVCQKNKIALIGFTMSLVIEFLQLISMRGTFEVSDILLNTLGIFLGIKLYKLAVHIMQSPLWLRANKIVAQFYKNILNKLLNL